MEYFNKIVCVTFDELTSGKDPVIKLGTLKSLQYRKRVDIVSRGGGEGNIVLYAYTSLPERYRIRFEQKYGAPDELIKEQYMKDRLQIDDEARRYYEDYRYDKGGELVSLTEKKKEEYTLNASVLNELITILNDRTGYRKALGGSTHKVWKTIIGTADRLRDSYGHTLPQNTARLRDKINQYKKEGYPCLISKKMGNANTLKITEEMGKMSIALKRSSVPVYTDAQIFEEINRMAKEKGWKSLQSIQSLRAFLHRPDIEPLWYDAVYGELKAHQRYGRKNKTKLPTMRDSLWYGDGTKINLYYKDYDKAGKPVVCTTQVYEVIDAYSEVFLGYHISDSEDYEAQYNAYRMAVQVSGHKPYELVHDNQGGHKKLQNSHFFDKIVGYVHRTTAPYSGQSKTIESVFGRFQAEILHKDWRFTEQNITTKKDMSRPNLERIEANKDKLYTLAELKVAYAAARKEWNESKHFATGVSRVEMYQNSVNPDTPAVGVLDMIDMFWIMTDKPSTYTDSGLKITIKKREYTYEVYEAPGVPDHEFLRKNRGQKFYTMYDPYDHTSVRLYKKDQAGELRFVRTAEPYFVIHRNIQEQTKDEMAFIRRNIEANTQDRIERQVNARIIEQTHGMSMEQQGLIRPKLKGEKNETMREIERRVRRYSQDPELVSIGKVTKLVSNMTFDQLNGDIRLNEKKVAGKL
ncbi:MAG: kinase [Phocaeicola sp.]|uniref:kinase n=1 Tax=Phocaeicola sp. TaxID=2773926 RepID=UPI003F9EF6F1